VDECPAFIVFLKKQTMPTKAEGDREESGDLAKRAETTGVI
jgi:hypothetical protein